MIALCVDDEPLVLESLLASVKLSPDISSAVGFATAAEALEWYKSNRADIAFLDIRLRATTGLDLSVRLRQLDPDLPVVFCTGYDEYARDAFRVHAAGYLTKPILPEDVQKEIDFILGKAQKKKQLLTVTCFGGFEVYADGSPLPVQRRKTKELLAYLIDRRGLMVTAKEISSVLWDPKTDERKNLNYLYKLLADLRSALKKVGAENVLISQNSSYAVDTHLVSCDYYRYLEGDPSAVRSFMGEYLPRYGWAQSTCAFLLSQHNS